MIRSLDKRIQSEKERLVFWQHHNSIKCLKDMQKKVQEFEQKRLVVW